MRSVAQDGVPLPRQVLTVAITIPTSDPRTVPTPTRASGANKFLDVGAAPWDLASVSQLKPGKSLSLDMSGVNHRRILTEWIEHAATIIGMNLAFDIMYLRRCFPGMHEILNKKTHFLIDLQVPMYLEDEERPEKSLKDIGIVMGTHVYSHTAKDRFDSIQEVLSYNAEDTHNTLLPLPVLCRRIRERYGIKTAKLSPWCLRYYNDCLWESIIKSENGVAFSYPKLLELGDRCKKDILRIEDELLHEHGLLIAGTGSVGSKEDFFNRVFDECPELLEHEMLERSEKTGKISTSRINRNLALILLPESSPHKKTLRLWDEHSRAYKLYSTYVHNLVWHRKNKPDAYGNTLVRASNRYRLPPTDTFKLPRQRTSVDFGIAYPTWFIVPGFQKDGGGESGGTIQVRPTAKGPALQTQPKPISSTIVSRFGESGRVVSYDASQIEMRTAALLSGDKTLCNAYEEGLDLHAGLAIHCEGPDIINHPDFHTGNNITDPRQHYKQANFLILFRGQSATLAATLLNNCGVVKPLHWCAEVISGLKSLRSGLWQWQDQIIEKAHADGFLELPFIGVSRTFGGDKFDENEIVNFPVQSFASLTIQRMESIASELLGPTSVLEDSPILPISNTYDSSKFDVKSEAHERELDDIMKEAERRVATEDIWGMLQEHYGRSVPFVLEKE